MSSAPVNFTLNNNVTMPAFGLGVFQSKPEETLSSIRCALDLGYRLIDTAAAYNNEKQVGEALRSIDISRDEIFITTKLKPADYGFDSALKAFDSSMEKLGLEVLDLYLLHWPLPMQFETTLASWRAAERLLLEGRVRAIGVCNFRPPHLNNLIAASSVVPAVNQVELHPYLVQNELREANSAYGIVTQAWSPIGGVNRYWESGDDPLSDVVITQLAEKYARTPAQIILRWHLDRNISVIPKSVNPGRIAENFAVYDFELSQEDIALIDSLDQNKRGGPDPDARMPGRPQND